MNNFKKAMATLMLLALVFTSLWANGAKENLNQDEQLAILDKIEESEVEAETIDYGEHPVYGTVNKDDMISAFSYAYGYFITGSLQNQGISFSGAYWLRGIEDVLSFNPELLISTDLMSDIVNEYVNDFYSQGKTADVGPIPTWNDLHALTEPESLVERFSYSYGVMYAVQLYYSNGLDLYMGEFIQGASDALWENPEQAMTEEEMDSAIETYANYLDEEYEAYLESIEELKKENLKKAEDFLAENKDKEGVITLSSGNQLVFTTQSEDGATPTDTDSVIVDYDLFLLDGTQCDSGSDITFSLSSLIPGFVEACTNMKVGDEAMVYIHPDYGYGENGSGVIEPNSLLIFRIALKSIVEN